MCMCVCASCVCACEQLPGNQSFDRQISAHEKNGVVRRVHGAMDLDHASQDHNCVCVRLPLSDKQISCLGMKQWIWMATDHKIVVVSDIGGTHCMFMDRRRN